MITDNETTRAVFEIPEQNLATLKARIEVLNRRAVKLGCNRIELSPVRLIVESEYKLDTRQVAEMGTSSIWRRPGEEPVRGYVATGALRRVHVIEVKGEAPKFRGWTLAATIQATTEGNILRCVPGVENLNPIFRTCTPACDHCKTNRNRRDTFVVIHDDGTQKQVGRQCIRDFLGHTDPEALARIAEMHFSVGEICREESENYGATERKVFGLITFLSNVAAVTEGKAFITGKMAKEEGAPQASSMCAYWNMFPTVDMRRRGEVVEVTEAHKTLAQNAVAFVLETIGTKDTMTDFDHNLLVAAKSEAIESRTCGIAAYIIPFFRRETEKAIERATRPVSAHFGEVKKRYKAAKLTYRGTNSFPTIYGFTHINRFVTAEGNLAVWKTSTDDMSWATQGAELTLDYTIKDHGDYKGTLQTYITRCKFIVETPSAQTV